MVLTDIGAIRWGTRGTCQQIGCMSFSKWGA